MLEDMLKENNSKAVVGDPAVKEEIIQYLDSHVYPHSIKLDFLKMFTKVGHSILKFDEKALTEEQVSKLIHYSHIAIHMLDNYPKRENSKKYSHMYSHLHAHLGELYLIQYRNNGDISLLLNALEFEDNAAELCKKDELENAFYSYKKSSEHNKSLYQESGNIDYLTSAAQSLTDALGIGDTLENTHMTSYSLFHLGLIYTNLFYETGTHAYAKKAHQYQNRLIKDPSLETFRKAIKNEVYLCNKLFQLTRRKKWKSKARSFNKRLYPENFYYAS